MIELLKLRTKQLIAMGIVAIFALFPFGRSSASVKYDERDLYCVVVPPLLTHDDELILWDYRGNVEGVTYYNAFIPEIKRISDGSIVIAREDSSPTGINGVRRGATGCLNTAMGAVMFSHAYPNPKEVESHKWVGKDFPVIKNTYEYGPQKTIQKKSIQDFHKIKGGTDEKGLYKWNVMKPYIKIEAPRYKEWLVYKRLPL